MTEKKLGHDNLAFELGTDSPEKGKTHLSSDGAKERAQWGNRTEFLMSCIAMSVGLGNIWRFPFTAQENGGGAFLIPYLIVLTLIGRPLYFMEMGLGQFTSKGNIKTFERLSPILKGVGYGQVLTAVLIGTYYCSIMALTIFYLINSFTNNFPWKHCLDKWNLDAENITCISGKENGSDVKNAHFERKSSSELYFKREVLQEYKNIDTGIGLPEWRLTLCLLAAWTALFVLSWKGVRSTGKASYFLAIFPYIIMFTLLVRAATLEGAMDGMYSFIKTDWEKLLEPQVWYAAVTQCFFSLNVGFGAIIMYASYNKFDQNIVRDALVVTTLDTFTSLLAGCTVFGILGNLAFQLEVEPEKVVNGGGTGLAFISYPDAIAKFDVVPWLFAILFFLMLLVLGLGSLIALQNSICTVIQDSFPNIADWKISLFSSICGFLLGLMYVTPGGQFMLKLVDFFGGTFIVFILIIFEVTGVTWFYGIENFCLDMEFMLKKKIGCYWRITWGLITPTLLIIIFVYFIVQLKPLTYENVSYPSGILAFGWSILAMAVVLLIYGVSYYLVKYRSYGFLEMLKKATSHERWIPQDESLIEEWKKFKEFTLNKRKLSGKSWIRNKFDFFIGK